MDESPALRPEGARSARPDGHDLLGHELSRYDANTAKLFGEASYLFTFKHATLEPFAQAAYVHLHAHGPPPAFRSTATRR